MIMSEVRDKLAAVLAPVDPTDPSVLGSLVDSIDPPALMLGWGEPWLEPDTPCLTRGRLVVTCVASRLVPGEGIGQLEDLVSYVLNRLRADPGNWPLESVSGPRVFLMANTNYLAARVTVRVPINH